MITKLLDKILTALASAKAKAVDRQLKNDPEYQKIQSDLEESRQGLRDWTARKCKEDPEFREIYKHIRKVP